MSKRIIANIWHGILIAAEKNAYYIGPLYAIVLRRAGSQGWTLESDQLRHSNKFIWAVFMFYLHN